MPLHGPGSLTVRRAIKAEAFKAFLDENVSFTEIDEWCPENCNRWNVAPELLRAWIVDAQQNEVSRANLERPNNAAKVANLMGATLKASLKVYVDALSAEKVRPLVSREGLQTGEVRTPDWEARLKAAEGINKILGAYAPEKMEHVLPQLDELHTRTEVELRRELSALRANQGNQDPPRAEGASGGEGLLLLADVGDAHEGRAGRGEPIQAVPRKPPVLSPDFTRARQ